MAVSALDAPRVRAGCPRPWLLVGLVSAVAFGAYALMRVDSGRAIQGSFAGWCARLGMQPQDWPCRVTGSHTLVLYLAGSLTVGLALAVPCAVLAATGRRLAALLPVLVPIGAAGLWAMTSYLTYMEPHAVGSPYLGMWPTLASSEPRAFWFTHAMLASIVDLILLTAPALAIVTLVRPRRERAAPRHARRWTVASLVICSVASGAAVWLLLILGHRLAPSESGFVLTEPGAWVVPVSTMAVFGWLLSTDRRWWPWVIVPVAVLLTGATATALMSSVSRIDSFGAFGEAIPYAAVGLIFSLGEPLARRLSRHAGAEPDPLGGIGSAGRTAPRRLRPAVALNAGAVTLVLFALTAFRFDPAPVEYQTAVPSYFEVRVHAQDLRTKLNLQLALGALGSYRDANGGYEGFDAAAGERAVPALAWADGIPTQVDRFSPPALVVGVLEASSGRAELVSLSDSGRAFCVRTGGSNGTTYGAGGRDWPSGMPDPAVSFARAVASCGAAPWTPNVLRPFPVASLCVGADDGSIIMCRATQRAIRETMRNVAPSGA